MKSLKSYHSFEKVMDDIDYEVYCRLRDWIKTDFPQSVEALRLRDAVIKQDTLSQLENEWGEDE